jgi:hypothetical protein
MVCLLDAKITEIGSANHIVILYLNKFNCIMGRKAGFHNFFRKFLSKWPGLLQNDGEQGRAGTFGGVVVKM